MCRCRWLYTSMTVHIMPAGQNIWIAKNVRHNNLNEYLEIARILVVPTNTEPFGFTDFAIIFLLHIIRRTYQGSPCPNHYQILPHRYRCHNHQECRRHHPQPPYEKCWQTVMPMKVHGYLNQLMVRQLLQFQNYVDHCQCARAFPALVRRVPTTPPPPPQIIIWPKWMTARTVVFRIVHIRIPLLASRKTIVKTTRGPRLGPPVQQLIKKVYQMESLALIVQSLTISIENMEW